MTTTRTNLGMRYMRVPWTMITITMMVVQLIVKTNTKNVPTGRTSENARPIHCTCSRHVAVVVKLVLARQTQKK